MQSALYLLAIIAAAIAGLIWMQPDPLERLADAVVRVVDRAVNLMRWRAASLRAANAAYETQMQRLRSGEPIL